jgi:hypothetical protein
MDVEESATAAPRPGREWREQPEKTETASHNVNAFFIRGDRASEMGEAPTARTELHMATQPFQFLIGKNNSEER